MENESLDVVIMFSIQRRLSLVFPQRHFNIMQNISRTTTLSSSPTPSNPVKQNSLNSQTNLQKIRITKRILISGKSQKYQKKKFVSTERKTIPKSSSSQSESIPSPQFPSQTITTSITSAGHVHTTSTTSAGLYHSRYYGTPCMHVPPPGYTHLSPGSSSAITPTLFQTGLTSPTLSASTCDITPIESSGYEPSISDGILYHHQPQSGARNKKTLNPLPRHKRESHINAEYRRRNKISSGFETLKSIIPSLRDSQPGIQQKESKSAMLNAATEYIFELKISCDENERMEQRLRQEIFDLEREIQFCQKGLPVGGVPTVENSEVHMQSLCRDYLCDRINNNWKFWIFSFLVRRLFLSFRQMATSSSFPAFLQSVKKWSDDKLQLNELRIEIIDLLKYISTNTTVMSTPDQLPQDAVNNFHKWQD